MEKKTAIARSVADREVQKWLDHKRVNDKHRNNNQDSIDNLIDAFEDGTLTLDEDHNINMKLAWPVGENEQIKSLRFKPRLKVTEIHKNMKGIKSTDADARILAYMATLTEQPTGIVANMDTEDYRTASSIVVFFF